MRDLIIILVILLSTMFLGADILHVPASYHYISLAILAAADGDTILVAPGNYSGIIDFEGKGILLASNYIFSGSEADIYNTRLRGNYSDTSLINFRNAETDSSRLCGFTVTNSSAPAQGGALYCDGATPVISQVRFEGNEATSGGAVFLNEAYPVFEDCEFVSNSGSDYGGAMYLENSSVSLDNCIFRDNFCGGDDVTGRAGAIFASNSSIYCRDSDFIENESQAHAGAIYLSYAQADLYRCNFSGNTAGGNVGGVYFYNSELLNVINCTFYNNTGSDAGALRFYHSTATVDVPFILNTVLWGNSPSEITCSMDDLENELMIAYSDIEGGEEGIVTNDNAQILWLDGNIEAEPLFMDSGEHFFAYESGSPCIDAGVDFFEYETTVYFETDEFAGASPEIGAEETDPSAPPVLALFESDICEGEAPLTVHFNNLSIGEELEWGWDFDLDGEIDSNEAMPEYTYETEGTYSVGLWINSSTQADVEIHYEMIEVLEASEGEEDEIGGSNLQICAYPNPFNPSTRLEFWVESAGEVSIEAYNVKGQKVATITSNWYSEGSHKLEWKPQEARSGIYFLRIKAGEKATFTRVLLLK